MRHFIAMTMAASLSIVLVLPTTATASEEHRAKKLCKNKITQVYGVSRFNNVWVEEVGNHKFKIHGKVRAQDHTYPFNCKVKNGHVKSYAYNGPHSRHRDDHDDSNLGTAVAVGAGLAIIAALAASADDDSDDKAAASDIATSKSVLEDDCHDMLQYRIRDEHDSAAEVRIKHSELRGRDLKGEAKVRSAWGAPQRATFSCHFNRNGRLLDSSYHLY